MSSNISSEIDLQMKTNSKTKLHIDETSEITDPRIIVHFMFGTDIKIILTNLDT